MLNFLCFWPSVWLPCHSVTAPAPLASEPSKFCTRATRLGCTRNVWREQWVPRIKTLMPAPMFGRVAAVLAPLVTFVVTFLVAPTLLTIPPVLGQLVPLPSQVVRRELRVGAPGVPSALEPGAALEGTSPLIARQVFDTLVAWREGSTEIEPALATRWNVSRD